jgi:signal transduction histidine kinase
MQHTEAALTGERILAALRWGVLMGLGLLAVRHGLVGVPVIVLLGLGALWNLSLTLLLSLGRRIPRQGLSSLIGDSLLALALFWFGGTLASPMVWAGLLPVICAALVWRLSGGLVAGVGVSLAFAGLASLDFEMSRVTAGMLVPALTFVGMGGLVGFLGQQLYIQLKQSSDLEMSAEVEKRRQERDRAKALAEITSALNSSLVVERVLETALDLSGDLMADSPGSYSQLLGCILLFHEGGLRVAAARRLPAGDLERTLAGQSGALKQVIESGEARVLDGVTKDPELRALSGFQQTKSVYITPLRFGLEMYGVLVYGQSQAAYFDEGRQELLDIVARQVMVALQNAQLYEALNEEKDRIAEIQEQARHQLARNLHDGPTQSVAAIAMRVNLARRLMARDGAAAAEELYKVEDLARRTTKEIRHMLFTLRPQALEEAGLVAALEDLARQTEDSYDQKVVIEADKNAVAHMDLGQQGVLFYIVAEGVTNARKHAQADTVTVRLKLAEPDVAFLEVEDDGVGFNLQEAEAKRKANGSLGLLTLRERVELINGLMQMDSSKGAGTRVRVWAPLNEAAAERLRHG